MEGRYICLRDDVWDGKIANIKILWKGAGRKKLAQCARDQGIGATLLKSITEHFMYTLAHRMRAKRLAIKMPLHEFALRQTNSGDRRLPESLQMSGEVIPSRRNEVQQVRIYLDAGKAVLSRYNELVVVGEAVFRSSRADGTPSLNMNASWGLGVETWVGPTFGGAQKSASPAARSQSNRSVKGGNALRAGCGHGVNTTVDDHRRMNPEAAEFCPRVTASRSDGMQTWTDPTMAQRSGTPLGYQYSGETYKGQDAVYQAMPGTIYETQPDPGHDMSPIREFIGHTWNPYMEWWRCYNFVTGQWESQAVDASGLCMYF
ncbi:hypothetical protein F4802DRAFT_129002 [Xylaria palmicola]|nr:hypothetical protein F4802DRAFT_129002 [Xylaria palmicola]